MSPSERSALALRFLPPLVSTSLGMGLIYTLIQSARLLGPIETLQWHPPEKTIAAVAEAIDVEAIRAAHLFGVVASIEAQAIDPNTAPATTLTLELLGLIASSDERIAHAIIGDGSGEQHIYFLHGAVPGGAVVASILPDRVILDRGGQLEALILPRTRNPNTLVGDSNPSFSGGASSANSAPPPTVAEEQPAARPVRLADIMMSRPHLQRGEFRGVEVYPGEQAAQFSNLGLQPGDVVTAIDGRPLTPGNAVAPFEGVAASTSLTLTVERQGKARTLRIVDGQPAASPTVKPRS